MTLTGLEQALIGFVILVIGGGGTKVALNKINGKKLNSLDKKFVPREICTTQHESLERVLKSEFNHLKESTKRLEKKLDKLNGKNA